MCSYKYSEGVYVCVYIYIYIKIVKDGSSSSRLHTFIFRQNSRTAAVSGEMNDTFFYFSLYNTHMSLVILYSTLIILVNRWYRCEGDVIMGVCVYVYVCVWLSGEMMRVSQS